MMDIVVKKGSWYSYGDHRFVFGFSLQLPLLISLYPLFYRSFLILKVKFRRGDIFESSFMHLISHKSYFTPEQIVSSPSFSLFLLDINLVAHEFGHQKPMLGSYITSTRCYQSMIMS
jgi:hypothetical protein